jgi:hypothetical protein
MKSRAKGVEIIKGKVLIIQVDSTGSRISNLPRT